MTAQLNLLTPPAATVLLEALTPEWQSLEELGAPDAWGDATQLVREYRAHHRAVGGVDHYRLPSTHMTTRSTRDL